MKKLSPHASPEQVLQARKEWADYIRLRRAPVKTCRGCKASFPNTSEFFARGPKGFLSPTCITCAQKERLAPPNRHAGCPICGTRAKLVRDHNTPVIDDGQPTYICRRCHLAVNLAGPRETWERLDQYVRWRNRWPASGTHAGRVLTRVRVPEDWDMKVDGTRTFLDAMTATITPDETGIDDGDDEDVRDPVGEPDSYPEE